MRKLKAILVDDTPLICEGMKKLFKNSILLEITETFTSPKKFLEAESTLDYDLCLLDIRMPEMDGFTVAKKITKPIIFITLAEEKLKEALALSPIDVVTKPFTVGRLESAFEKAQKLILLASEENDYALFNVLEKHAKMRIRLSDIVFVESDSANPRNKHIWTKDAKEYIITDFKFERLLKMTSTLIQVNKRMLISLEAVESFKYDLINLKRIRENGMPKQVTLGDSYRKKFLSLMPSM